MADRDETDGIRPVRVMSAASHAVVELVMAFRLETIRPGDHLPTISVLSDRLGVSPAIAQAAVALLARCGVLDVKRGRNGGIWLRNLTAITDALAQVMPDLRYGRAHLEDLLEVRRILQTEAAIRTAAKSDDAIRRQMQEYVERMKQLQEQTANFLKVGAELNCAIALHSGNPVLADSLIRLIDEIAVAGSRAKQRLRAHPNVLGALIKNQKDLVDAIVRNHTEGIRSAVSAQMKISLSVLK